MSETTSTSDGFSPEEATQFESMREDGPEPEVNAAEPAERAAPEPEAKPEPKAEEQPKTVPHAALHEERTRRQAVEKQMLDQQVRFDALLAQFAPQQQQQAQQPPVAFEQDPQTYIQNKFQTQEQEIAQLRQWRDQQQQEGQQQQQMRQLTNHATAQEVAFRQTAPDYDAAVSHLLQSRDQELQMLGIADPNLRQQTIMQDRLALAHHAATTGQDVAKMVYDTAKLRGYAPKSTDGDNSAEQLLETVARGQKLGLGVGSQGAAPASRVNALAISKMSESEFSAFAAKNPAAMKAAMGG